MANATSIVAALLVPALLSLLGILCSAGYLALQRLCQAGPAQPQRPDPVHAGARLGPRQRRRAQVIPSDSRAVVARLLERPRGELPLRMARAVALLLCLGAWQVQAEEVPNSGHERATAEEERATYLESRQAEAYREFHHQAHPAVSSAEHSPWADLARVLLVVTLAFWAWMRWFWGAVRIRGQLIERYPIGAATWRRVPTTQSEFCLGGHAHDWLVGAFWAAWWRLPLVLVLLAGCAELPQPVGGGVEGARLRLLFKDKPEEIDQVWTRSANKAAADLGCTSWSAVRDTSTADEKAAVGQDDKGQPIHPWVLGGPWVCYRGQPAPAPAPASTTEQIQASGGSTTIGGGAAGGAQ